MRAPVCNAETSHKNTRFSPPLQNWKVWQHWVAFLCGNTSVCNTCHHSPSYPQPEAVQWYHLPACLHNWFSYTRHTPLIFAARLDSLSFEVLAGDLLEGFCDSSGVQGWGPRQWSSLWNDLVPSDPSLMNMVSIINVLTLKNVTSRLKNSQWLPINFSWGSKGFL